MKTILAALVLLLSTAAVADIEVIRSPETHFFHESFGDLSEELAIANDEGKFGVMIMFEVNDCPWCERMKKNVFNRAQIQDYFRSYFRIIIINAEGDTIITDFDGSELPEKDFALQHNRIRATPTFLFFDQSGQLAARHIGTTKNMEEFLWLGQYVVEGHYKNEKFIQFKRKKKESTKNFQ